MIFKVAYVGLVHDGFVTLYGNYSHIILEHVNDISHNSVSAVSRQRLYKYVSVVERKKKLLGWKHHICKEKMWSKVKVTTKPLKNDFFLIDHHIVLC